MRVRCSINNLIYIFYISLSLSDPNTPTLMKILDPPMHEWQKGCPLVQKISRIHGIILTFCIQYLVVTLSSGFNLLRFQLSSWSITKTATLFEKFIISRQEDRQCSRF